MSIHIQAGVTPGPPRNLFLTRESRWKPQHRSLLGLSRPSPSLPLLSLVSALSSQGIEDDFLRVEETALDSAEASELVQSCYLPLA